MNKSTIDDVLGVIDIPMVEGTIMGRYRVSNSSGLYKMCTKIHRFCKNFEWCNAVADKSYISLSTNILQNSASALRWRVLYHWW